LDDYIYTTQSKLYYLQRENKMHGQKATKSPDGLLSINSKYLKIISYLLVISLWIQHIFY